MTNTSAQRCKKYGHGRNSGTHHSRRARIADPTKASEAQANRAAKRAKAKRTARKAPAAQGHVKTLAQVGGILDRDRNPMGSLVIVAQARPKPEEQLRDRIVRRPGASTPRVALIGDNTTTVAETLEQMIQPEPAPGVIHGDDVIAAAVVTDADRDSALAALAHLLDEEVARLYALPIEGLELTVRPYNALKREGINSIGELVGKTEAELLDIQGLGQRSIDLQIKPKLAALNPPLSLKDDTPADA